MKDTEKEIEEFKLFVGGLPARIEEEAVLSFFQQFGEIASCQLKVNARTKRSLGFAYVEAANQETYDRLLNEPIHFETRLIEVKKFLAKAKLDDKLVEEKEKKLFVTGLPLDLSNEELVEFFSSFGTVLNGFIIKDIETEESKSYGYVKFQTNEEIEKVLSVSDLKIRGDHPIEVEKATNKQRISQKKHYIQEEKKKGLNLCDTKSSRKLKKDKYDFSNASTDLQSVTSQRVKKPLQKKSLKLSSPCVKFDFLNNFTSGTFSREVISEEQTPNRTYYSPFISGGTQMKEVLKNVIGSSKSSPEDSSAQGSSQKVHKPRWLRLSTNLNESPENYGFHVSGKPLVKPSQTPAPQHVSGLF